MAVRLASLCAGLPGVSLSGDDGVEISQVTADSRQAGPGVLFVAVRGASGDGHRFVADAIAAGCPAVAVEDTSATAGARACLVSARTRHLPALLARRLHGEPDLALMTAGVTGTNGKTTTAFLLQALLNSLQGPCGLLGTIRYDDGRRSAPAPLTTPGGPVLYRWLGEMVANGCRSVALEVSSHALDQDRAAGLQLDAAIMTNLGRDHLDYHADMADYLRAKARIAELLRPASDDRPAGALVINAADPQLVRVATEGRRVVRFATQTPAPELTAPVDLQVTGSRLDLDGTDLTLDWRGRELTLRSRLVGRYNVENLTAALAAGLALGFAPEDCAAALADVDQVPGRLERLPLPCGGIAVVDYAHTHDALAAVLAACRELTDGRLLVVFGCGGDRDRGKRPLMGAVGARDADMVWITSDNPRSEDPAAICAEIEAGARAESAPRARSIEVVVDRRRAIGAALAAAGAGDVVVIAGKGHEDYQIIGDRRLDFDDRQAVRDWVSSTEADGGGITEPEQGHGD